MSEPCQKENSTFSHFNQSETFSAFEKSFDSYKMRDRLDLYEWDGTPLMPMWLAFRTPVLLPTRTLKPTSDVSTVGNVRPTATSVWESVQVKRQTESRLLMAAFRSRTLLTFIHGLGSAPSYSSRSFWVGVGFSGVGSCLMVLVWSKQRSLRMA